MRALQLKDRTWSGLLLALGFAASVGPSIAYVNVVLNPLARWVVLLLLVLALFVTGRLFSGLRGYAAAFGLPLLVYATFSTFWSPLPNLTGLKSVTFLLVAIAYSAAGAVWAASARRWDSFNVLWPVLILTILSGLGGLGIASSKVQMNETVNLYRGLTANSNFLGLLALFSLPLPLWYLARPDTTRGTRRLHIAILIYIGYLLASSLSRASLLGAAIMLVIYLLGRGAQRFVVVLAGMAAFSVLLSILFPALIDSLVVQFVYKGDPLATSVLASREDNWSLSYEGAAQGGLFGLGYGVSFGFNTYDVGLAAMEYGREKGNVSLAIIEEVGLLGFGLFVGFIIAVLIQGVRAAMTASMREDRMLLALMIGSLVGMVANAQFESWLFSPGGAGTPIFWATVGMIWTTSRNVVRDKGRRARHLRFAQRANHWAKS
ncbi:O-antigen ligase family protein [Oryzicola mucosus]|uniref:O-antigen ligase family protein n=1 Tax=Oryzicola mucosus TaxID=2767425 RepID=A0A8J6PGD2_9HYPH|nr:O-antigen ligase family protein [Oryzicola mucosus]MBD0413478.1 O-antigen ligase family protein [Oryzicola mucosus]